MNTDPRNQYPTSDLNASTRVTTDSESMARDIKEGRLSGFVGHGTVLTGETQFQAMLRVDGHLQGSVSSDSGTLIVGTQGQVDANMAVATALVHGVVNGDIVATEKIQLGRTARVVGNIQTPKLLIEEGAVFEGACTMLKARDQQEKRDNEAKSQSTAAQYSSYSTATAAVDDDDDDLLATDDEDEESAEAAAS